MYTKMEGLIDDSDIPDESDTIYNAEYKLS